MAERLEHFESECDKIYEEIGEIWNNSKNKEADRKMINSLLTKMRKIYVENNDDSDDPWKLAIMLDKGSIPEKVRKTKFCDLHGAITLGNTNITCQGQTFQLTQFGFEYCKEEFDRLVTDGLKQLNKENIGDNTTTEIEIDKTPKKILNDTMVNVQQKPGRPVNESELRNKNFKIILASEFGTPLIVDRETKKNLEDQLKTLLQNKN